MNGIKSLVVLGLELANETRWQKTEQRERGRAKCSPGRVTASGLHPSTDPLNSCREDSLSLQDLRWPRAFFLLVSYFVWFL